MKSSSDTNFGGVKSSSDTNSVRCHRISSLEYSRYIDEDRMRV